MEEFIQIMIFVGAMVIAVISQNVKNKKKPTTASPQEVLEDIFPEMEIQGEETGVSQPPPFRPVHKDTSARKRPMPQVHPPLQQKDFPAKENKISLNSREKAKRAFIYSEIFNRKY